MNYMKNPHPYWSSHPIYTPRFLFFPLFAKVIMLWCGHVPTDALVFRSVALFTKMCSAIQFHFHVFTREPGGAEGKWSSGAHPVSSTAFISCVYISLIPVSTFLFPLLNIGVTVYLTGCSYLKQFCKPTPDMYPAFEDKRRLSQVGPKMCFDACLDFKAFIQFLIW